MNTLNTLKTQWKKALVLGALTLAPTLTATQAQAAPSRPAPTSAWNNQHANRYDNNRRNDSDSRWDNRNDNRYDNNHRSDNRWDDRNDHRFDPRRDDHRYDNNRYDYNHNRYDDRDNKNNTAKIIGAGVVGAILGAVLSR